MERAGGLKYEVVPCTWLSDGELYDYMDEITMPGEDLHVLWECDKIGPAAWKKKLEIEAETLYGAFLVDDRLVGVCRITKEPKHEANGKMGYSIRPSERGKGFAKIFLAMIGELGARYGVEELTACVDERNERSRRALEAAGWERSGRTFDWRPNPEPRKAVEYVLK